MEDQESNSLNISISFQDQRRRCHQAVGPGDEALPGLSAGDWTAGGMCPLRVSW